MSDRLPAILSRSIDVDRAEFELFIPSTLFWFLGHFPSQPILPGIVQLHWALFLAKDAGLPVPVSAQDFQVKYQAMVLPEMYVHLSVMGSEERGIFNFKYINNDQIFSSGSARLVPRGLRHE